MILEMEAFQNGTLDAVVLGAGVSGLSIALELTQLDQTVLVLETGERIGGAIDSVRSGGFLYERGPNSLLLRRPEVAQWLERRGLTSGLIDANPEAKRRYLVRGGRIVAMPSGPLSAVATPLYSPWAKLGVLGEPFRPSLGMPDEDAASFVSRRLGREFYDYGIAALINGIWAGDGSQLSMRHAFPRVWNLEQEAGSLVRGALALQKARREAGAPPWKSRMVTWPEGLATLPRRMAVQLAEPVRLGIRLESIEPRDHAWEVRYRNAQGAPRQVCARHLVVTAPVHTWADIPFLPRLRTELAMLPVPRYAPVATLFLGFARETVQHPLDGFGVLIPPRESRGVLGAVFSSSLFPGRAPEDHVALTCFLGGMHFPDLVHAPEDELLALAQRELGPLLGLKGQPIEVQLTRWPRAIPQYELGHGSLLESASAIERQWPGLILAGNFRDGPGLYDSLDSGRRLAAQLANPTTGVA